MNDLGKLISLCKGSITVDINNKMNELINNKLSIPTIALIIFNKENNKFLLLKNKRGKYGFLTEKHKEKGNYQNDILLSKEESLKQTAQRGAKEELDLDIYFHESEEKVGYLDFVQAKLKHIERYNTLIRENRDTITPQILNHALASHNGILNWLIKEYEDITLDYNDLIEDLKADMDEWIIEARKTLNENQVKSKFASATEVESHARVKHREEYIKHKRKILVYERKVSFYRRIMESWAGNKTLLENMSWNMRTEMKALPIEDYANKDMATEKKIKIVPNKNND